MGDQRDGGIAWCDETWNCIRGCSRVSEGCRHCYAETVAARFSGKGQAYEGLADRARPGSKWTGVVRMVPEHLADPIRWKRPRRIFVNSMSDLFHESLTNEQIAAVFGVMAACPQHTFQVLTKRAKRMREWFAWIANEPTPLVTIRTSPRLMCRSHAQLTLEEHDPKRYPIGFIGTESQPRQWPLPNVWIGVSVENQAAADERIPELLATPAAVRFLSCEPLLGAVDLTRIGEFHGEHLSALEEIVGHVERPRIDWVIAGCESGHGSRDCDVSWLRSLRDQCAAADVAYFLKQAEESLDHGDHGFDMNPDNMIDEPIRFGDGSNLKARRKGANRIVELPYLDGVQHANFPEAR